MPQPAVIIAQKQQSSLPGQRCAINMEKTSHDSQLMINADTFGRHRNVSWFVQNDESNVIFQALQVSQIKGGRLIQKAEELNGLQAGSVRRVS